MNKLYKAKIFALLCSILFTGVCEFCGDDFLFNTIISVDATVTYEQKLKWSPPLSIDKENPDPNVKIIYISNYINQNNVGMNVNLDPNLHGGKRDFYVIMDQKV